MTMAQPPFSHLFSGLLTFLSLLSAPVMLAAGAGIIECPPSLCLAASDPSLNKFVWAGEKVGVGPNVILLLVGLCKILALLDIFVLKVMPKVTLVCVGCMFAAITISHMVMGESVQPVFTFMLAPFTMAKTWPPAETSAAKAKKKSK